MIMHPNELRRRIRESMEANGLDATELARRIGRGADYIRDFLNERKHSIKPADLEKIEDVLGRRLFPTENYEVPMSEIWDVNRSMLVGPRETHGLNPNNMFIHTSRPISFDKMEIQAQPIDNVSRPWYLKEAKGSFAFFVSSQSMEPAFIPGEIAIVNTKIPVAKNKHTLFIQKKDESENFVGTLRTLVDWDATVWKCSEYSPARETELSRQEWPEALRVVGKTDG